MIQKALRRFALLLLALAVPGPPLLAQNHVDTMGFHWDFSSGGGISDGSNDTFDGGFNLTVNGTRFSGNGTPRKDGSLQFGPNPVGEVIVSRTVFKLKEPAGLVYVDTFRNEGKAPVTLRLSIESNMGGSAGTPQNIPGKKGGIQATVIPQSPSRSSVAWVFGDQSTRFLPQGVATRSDNVSITYPDLELKAGQTRSLAYIGAQRSMAGAAVELTKDPRAFRTAVRFANAAGEFDLINASREFIFDLGDLDIVAPGAFDLVQTREGDRVYGEVRTTDFVLRTVRGARKFPFSRIVNAIGLSGGQFQVITLQGEILTGQLEPSPVQMSLSDGAAGEIALSEVRRLVPKAQGPTRNEEMETWFSFEDPLFQLRAGDRIAGRPVTVALTMHTSMGTLEVPLDRVQKILFGSDDDEALPFMARVSTLDGEQFSGILYGTLEVDIAQGERVSLPVQSLVSAYFQPPPPESEEADDPAAGRARLQLSGEDFILAELLEPKGGALELHTVFGPRKLTPRSIAGIQSSAEVANRVKVTMWDGSELTGTLAAAALPFRVLGMQREIPASSGIRYENPVAVPPAEIASRYRTLIEKLDSEDFAARKEAFDALAAAGPAIAGLLREAQPQASPEVQLSLRKLLAGEKLEPESPEAD